MNPAVSIQHLSKKYKLSKAPAYITLRESIAGSFQKKGRQKKEETFWALQDINIQIPEGERMGIVGHNGAGKSTLLKIVSRITAPTTGEIILQGRVASLLEVGTGFHPELSGRENIYLNGSLLGLKKKEIDKKLEEMVAFSGVAQFIDSPLKQYSSGMQLRLAFSVAAHLEAEILLIDEVLAVGDMEFQKKCIGKMEEVSNQKGKTIVFVSHNFQQLKAICTTGILLEQGKLIFQSGIQEVIHKYTAGSFNQNSFTWSNPHPDRDHSFICVQIKNNNNELIHTSITPETGLNLEIVIRAKTKILFSLLSIRFTNTDNIPVYTTTNGDEEKEYPVIEKGEHIYSVPVPVHLFVPGRYALDIAWIVPNVKELDAVHNELFIDMENRGYPGFLFKDGRLGLLNYPIRWEKIR